MPAKKIHCFILYYRHGRPKKLGKVKNNESEFKYTCFSKNSKAMD